MFDFIAMADDGMTIVAASNDMTAVRNAAEAYVREHERQTVGVYAKGQTVTVVCAPKWG